MLDQYHDFFKKIMVSVIKILRCVEHFTLHLFIFRKQITASLIKMKFAIIQARFINIVVVNINKSSAQTILFHFNIEFTNFFLKNVNQICALYWRNLSGYF